MRRARADALFVRMTQAFIKAGGVGRIDVASRRGRKRAHPEDDLQRAVCRYWAFAYPHSWPMMFHSPQGMAARNPKLAAIFAGLGVKPGVLDLICIHRRGPYNGLAIELKVGRGVVSDAQWGWLHAFDAEGWSAHVAYSFDEARAVIDAYHQWPAARTEVTCSTNSFAMKPDSARTAHASADAAVRSTARGTRKYGYSIRSTKRSARRISEPRKDPAR